MRGEIKRLNFRIKKRKGSPLPEGTYKGSITSAKLLKDGTLQVYFRVDTPPKTR